MKARLLIATLFVVPVIFFYLQPNHHDVTFHLDHVRGLQKGDAVYFNGLKVGEVRELALEDQQEHQRVEIQIRIFDEFSDAVPVDATFLLWPDELEPEQRSIRILGAPSQNSRPNVAVESSRSTTK